MNGSDVQERPYLEGKRVLLFAEDPGAANYVGAIASQLGADRRRANPEVALFACAGAAELFAERGLGHSELVRGQNARSLINSIKPSLIVVGTAESTETFGLKLILEARRLGVLTIGVVDSCMNAEFRFRGTGSGPLHALPDFLFVPDTKTCEEFCRLGVGYDRIFEIGHLHLAEAKKHASRISIARRGELRSRYFPGVDRDRPAVLFLAEKSSGFDPDLFSRRSDYTLHGSGRFDGRTEIVMEEVLLACRRMAMDPYLSIRLHPKCTLEEFEPLIRSFDHVQVGGDPLENVLAADVVIGMTTSLVAEAVALGCQVISVVPRQTEASWLPNSISRHMAIVCTRRSLETALLTSLEASTLAAHRTNATVACNSGQREESDFAQLDAAIAIILQKLSTGP